MNRQLFVLVTLQSKVGQKNEIDTLNFLFLNILLFFKEMTVDTLYYYKKIECSVKEHFNLKIYHLFHGFSGNVTN